MAGLFSRKNKAIAHRKSNLLVGTGLAGFAMALVAFPQSVQAQCAATGPNDTDCTGNDPGPVVIVGNDQIVRVLPGATVADLRINGDDSLVQNEGEISNDTSRFAVQLEALGGTAQVDNDGTILATDPGGGLSGVAVLINNAGANGLAVLNSSGTIRMSGDDASGALLSAGAPTGSVLVNLSDTSFVDITGTTAARGLQLQAQDSIQLVNEGDIISTATGSNGASTAVTVAATMNSNRVVNRGTIEANAEFAFGLAQSGAGLISLVNEGSITATGGLQARAVGQSIGAGDLLLENSGSIVANADAVAISRFGGGETQVANLATGLIEGSDRAIVATTFAGPFQIINAGTIRSTNTFNNPAALATILITPAAGSLGSTVSIENSGTIEAAGTQAIRAILDVNDSISLDNSGTIDGNIILRAGLPSVVLNSGTINGNISVTDGDDLVRMSGADAVHVGDLRGRGGADTLELLQTSNFLIDGLIDGFETVLVDDGSVTLDGANIVSAGSPFVMTIAGDATALLQSSTGFALADGGEIVLEGTLIVDPGAVLDAAGTSDTANFVARSGSTIRFGVDSGADLSGQIRADAIEFESGSQIDIEVRDMDVLANGTTFDVAVANDALTDASNTLTDNSVLFDFTKEVIGGTILRFTMQQLLSIADTINSDDPNSAALAGGLQGLIDSGSPSAMTVSTALGQFATVDELANAVAGFAPDSSNATALLMFDAIDRTHRIVRLRDYARTIEGGDVAIWLHGALLGSGLDSDGALDGFDGDGWDIAGGADAMFGESGFIGGLGFGSGGGDHERDGPRFAEGSYNASRLFAYVATTRGKLHFNADFGLGWGDVDTAREIAVLDEIALGATDFDQTFGRAEIGYAFGAEARQVGFSLTPVIGLQFSDVSFDAFEEAGSAGALSISERKVSSTRGDIGAIASWVGGPDGAANWSLIADLRWQEELGDSDHPLQAQFVGGGNSFTYGVNTPSGSSFSAELGAAFALGGVGNITLGYRGVFGGGADNQAGSITYSLGF